MKLFLDDVRPTPDGWARAYTAPEAIAFLAMGQVTEISLDHDLGEGPVGSGYDVACWIEEHAHEGSLPRLTWRIHSANTVGRDNMAAALKSAERFWTLKEERT